MQIAHNNITKLYTNREYSLREIIGGLRGKHALIKYVNPLGLIYQFQAPIRPIAFNNPPIRRLKY